MKKVIAIITVGFGLLLIVGTLSFMPTRYWVRTFNTEGDVLWHQDECYILVNAASLGWSGNYAKEKFSQFAAWAGFSPLPRVLRHDVTLFHFKNKRLEKYNLEGLDWSGNFFPYHGTLHFFQSLERKPHPVWRWSGSEFIKLSTEESAEANTSFKLFSELLAREGWSKLEMVTTFRETEKSYTIKLDDAELILTVNKSVDNEQKTISLRGPSLNPSDEVLCEFDGTWKRVDKATYQQLVPPASN
jgi:hypothetical protein